MPYDSASVLSLMRSSWYTVTLWLPINLLQLILPAFLHPFLFFLTSHSPPGLRWWIICEILAGSLSRVVLKGDGDTNENDIYISCYIQRAFVFSLELIHTDLWNCSQSQASEANKDWKWVIIRKKMSGIRHLNQQMSAMLILSCQCNLHRDRLDI